jgi:hypothetical protein
MSVTNVMTTLWTMQEVTIRNSRRGPGRVRTTYEDTLRDSIPVSPKRGPGRPAEDYFVWSQPIVQCVLRPEPRWLACRVIIHRFLPCAFSCLLYAFLVHTARASSPISTCFPVSICLPVCLSDDGIQNRLVGSSASKIASFERSTYMTCS